MTKRPSIAEIIVQGEAALSAAGVPAARLEAEVLVACRLGLKRGALLSRWRELADAAVAEALKDDFDLRASRYPLQYITGVQEFYSLEIAVDERVLIPRPETEMIVDEVLRLAREGQLSPARAPDGAGGEEAGPLVVDVGTGSGCIAVAIAVNLPTCRFFATDLSEGALEVAHDNAKRHGVDGRIRFAQGDGLAPALEAGLAGRADLVVSNPPYIDEADLGGLQPELRHEPRMALSPGRDGMAVTRTLIRDAEHVLRPAGRLLVELSLGRSQEAIRLLESGPWEDAGVRPDLQGIPRLLIARRQGRALA